MPFLAISLRRNLSGICTKMPAPSPVAGSDPLAPRWSIWAFIVRVLTMMSWERRPLRWAMKPTPHESFSWDGCQSPWAWGQPRGEVGAGDMKWVGWEFKANKDKRRGKRSSWDATNPYKIKKCGRLRSKRAAICCGLRVLSRLEARWAQDGRFEDWVVGRF